MKNTERFLSSDKKTQLLTYWYIPGEPKAVLRLCHGMSEYIGRAGYDNFARFLCDNGIAVVAHDYIGHGGSSEKKDLGFFADKDGYKYLLDDVYNIGILAEEKLPGVKQMLFGHSMGSLIARMYLADNPGEVKKAVLMGTLGPIPVGKLAVFLASLITGLKGTRAYSELLYKLSFGSYLDRIENPSCEYDWLSTDALEVQKYADDELCGFRFTNSAMRDLIMIYEYVSRKDWAYKLDKDTPLLFVSGDEDPCGSYAKGVEIIHDRVKEAGVPSVLKLYKGMRHELLNEPVKEQVYADILTFINEEL
ncbi:MAG: alpha/beta fold hydrolase [Christensenellaceae bacterium]|nr:alpha/beta fold hydrolase [Christensenellaceae bacterium]